MLLRGTVTVTNLIRCTKSWFKNAHFNVSQLRERLYREKNYLILAM